MNLHGQIMNLRVPGTENGEPMGWSPAYLQGHKHARHAAAELALAADAKMDLLCALLTRYRDETPLRHQPHMIAHQVDEVLGPNVRAKRATTAWRQARAGENVPRTARPGLVTCRWRSA
jgi:hypothetical protein